VIATKYIEYLIILGVSEYMPAPLSTRKIMAKTLQDSEKLRYFLLKRKMVDKAKGIIDTIELAIGALKRWTAKSPDINKTMFNRYLVLLNLVILFLLKTSILFKSHVLKT